LPVLILMPLIALGCSRAIVDADNPKALAVDEYRATYEAAAEVLRDYGFVIDRRDYRFGWITTRPLGSPNLFEIWNPQNTTAHQAMESTLASERRRVNVMFTRADSTGGDYTLEVEVLLERKQVTTRRLAGSARRNVFSDLAASPNELANTGVTPSYFQPVGRDPYLEARLIQEITDRARTGQ